MSYIVHKLRRLNVYCWRTYGAGLQSVIWYFHDYVPCPLAHCPDSIQIRAMMHRKFAFQFPLIDAQPPIAAVWVSYLMIYFLTLPYVDVNVIALSRLLKLRVNQAVVLHLIPDVSVNQLQNVLFFWKEKLFKVEDIIFLEGKRKINVKSLLNKFYG